MSPMAIPVVANVWPGERQDFSEPENLRESDRASLNDRLGRVESLLEKVLRRLDNLGEKREPPMSPPIGTVDSSNPSSGTAITPANENAPVLPLFDNGVLGFQPSDASPPSITLYGTMNHEWEKLRHGLLALLPSYSTLKRLAANSCWWLVRAQCFQDYEESLLPYSLASLSNHHPVVIAKALLWVVICLQNSHGDSPLIHWSFPALQQNSSHNASTLSHIRLVLMRR
ncbi:uncharacterized protein N7484_002525 [Penicillium longicatenatum]|uniref:uncharacterized protein n=1 Tax=Penicillium longicatenatum TaxID=1561947 RepID=UPI002547A8F9|nr:uncharacterized protein N7484_002525 [Penicillium longicatenatum]KAJ5648802.1 hypothetical protein N7484_002525 [Penicillium longicatenatum]